ncbi:unnamed protein product [Gordionus sp. m RMFG-2023]
MDLPQITKGDFKEMSTTSIQHSPRKSNSIINSKNGNCSNNLSLSTSIARSKHLLNIDNINPSVKLMEYAVRGPIVTRATELEYQIKERESGKYQFEDIIKTNIGDAHAMGQKPITFFRQVLALLSYPQLITTDPEKCVLTFPSDVIAKAKRILNACSGHSLGSYSASAGLDIVRRDVASFITRRDGVGDCHFGDVFLSAGASEAIRNVLFMFKQASKDAKKTGVMIPIPQYPLYSATLTEYDMDQVGYQLNETDNWSLQIETLKHALERGKAQSDVRVLCVINPGNPTGQVLSHQNMKEIIQFAYDNHLFLMCDEVYQENIYEPGLKWKSFRKVLKEDMPAEVAKTQELASFYSASKGYMGECGLRGGYVQFENVERAVKELYIKMISARLCPTTLGQALMGCIVNPPSVDDPSGPLFYQEKDAILKALAKRAKLTASALNRIPGVVCNNVSGAMYAFPRISIPANAVALAKSKNMEPDFMFSMELLEAEGLCVVPGSGFGQQEGTYHFRYLDF